MDDTEKAAATPSGVTLTIPPLALIGILIALGFLASNEPAARFANAIFLGIHLITLCYLLAYGILVQVFVQRWDYRGWKFLAIFGCWMIFCGFLSRSVVFNVRWERGPVGFATLISGVGLAVNLTILYLMLPSSVLIRGWTLAPLVEKFNAAIASQNYREALEALQPELKRKRPDAVFILLAGSTHLKLGETETGLRLLQDGLSKCTRDPQTLAAVAWTYHVFNRPDLGQPLLNEALEKDRQHPSVSLIHCQYLISSGHFEEARELWLRAKDTTDPMAQSFLTAPDFQKGIELLENHIDPTPC
jgi:tetratricopeptide (TPR) repeat protein